MSFATQENPTPISEQMLLAQRELGLYYPTDLEAALHTIGQANNTTDWQHGDQASPTETSAYFFGQELACEIWRKSPAGSPALPFTNVENLNLPQTEHPQNVLLVGCAGIESYRLGRNALQKMGVMTRNHWTVDISRLPLQRIKNAIPTTTNFNVLSDEAQQALLRKNDAKPAEILLQQDATALPFDDASIDLVLTDLFFGSQEKEAEREILAETARVTKDGGQFVLRASVMSDQNIQVMMPYMKNIGTFWEKSIKRAYGEDTLTDRDRYIGLTPDQWRKLGELYTSFLLKYYFGPNRFTSLEQIINFTQTKNQFRVQEVIRQEIPFGAVVKPMEYVTIRAEKTAA